MMYFSKCIISIIILFPFSSLGQNYTPMVKEGSTWINVIEQSDFPLWHEIYTTKLLIHDSTLYNGYKYHYLHKMTDSSSQSVNNNTAELIREDSLGRIFIRMRRASFPNLDTFEYQLYDFGMKVGDTSYLNRSNSLNSKLTYVLKMVDSIIVSGQKRRRYHFDVYNSHDYQEDNWIEGIGSPELGFYSFNNLFTGPGYSHEYIGCYWNSQIYWRRDITRDCAVLSINETYGQRKRISVYPNPTQDKVYLKNLEQDLTYRIYNIDGKLLTKGDFINQHFFDLSPYPKGLFLVTLSKKEKRFADFKIIKQ